MKILFLVQIFETPSDTGSERHFFFAKSLVEYGHEVHVLTSNIDYKNAVPRFIEHKKTHETEIDGFKVTYISVFTNFRGSLIRRVRFFISFFVKSLYNIMKLRNFDAVYAVSTPLTVGLLGVIAGKAKRIPLYFEVTDLWPDAAVQAGAVKNPVIIAVARIVERICYRSAKKVICLTNGIRSGVIAGGTPSERTELITNGVDFSLFDGKVSDRSIKMRSAYGLEQKFVAMYMGAHGAYNALDTIIHAATELKENDNIVFVLVGAGERKFELEKYVSDHMLTNVKFIGTVPRRDSADVLAMADIFLLPNRAGSFFEGNLPNKLFDYLASARPIVVAGRGETADAVLAANSGVVVEAEEPIQMAEAIVSLANSSEADREILGQNGRRYVQKFYDRKIQASLLSSLLK
jgi:colanic acid biosynthesis glycosyl transferase WcaI